MIIIKIKEDERRVIKEGEERESQSRSKPCFLGHTLSSTGWAALSVLPVRVFLRVTLVTIR